jgi:hypothetical protein
MNSRNSPDFINEMSMGENPEFRPKKSELTRSRRFVGHDGGNTLLDQIHFKVDSPSEKSYDVPLNKPPVNYNIKSSSESVNFLNFDTNQQVVNYVDVFTNVAQQLNDNIDLKYDKAIRSSIDPKIFHSAPKPELNKNLKPTIETHQDSTLNSVKQFFKQYCSCCFRK